MTIHLVSFGYGHGPVPAAAVVLDVRDLLHNPAADPALRTGTGLDEPVFDHVMATPGAARLVFSAAVLARGLAHDTRTDVTLAIGCTGGRHRSVALARRTHELLAGVGDTVTLHHRDVHKPLLPTRSH